MLQRTDNKAARGPMVAGAALLAFWMGVVERPAIASEPKVEVRSRIARPEVGRRMPKALRGGATRVVRVFRSVTSKPKLVTTAATVMLSLPVAVAADAGVVQQATTVLSTYWLPMTTFALIGVVAPTVVKLGAKVVGGAATTAKWLTVAAVGAGLLGGIGVLTGHVDMGQLNALWQTSVDTARSSAEAVKPTAEAIAKHGAQVAAEARPGLDALRDNISRAFVTQHPGLAVGSFVTGLAARLIGRRILFRGKAQPAIQ